VFLTALSSWIRGFLSVALVLGGILLVKEWVDDLPREEPIATSPSSPIAPGRPLHSLPDRLAAWRGDPDRSTAPLLWGGLLLLLTVGGRFVSPRLWRRRGAAPRVPPARIERVQTRRGYPLHVEVYGRQGAPPLLLVHGVGSDRTQWLEVMEGLSESFRVIAYDLLGHGRSSHPREADYSLEAMAVDLDDVMTYAGPDRMLLAGHSMGGMIALTWCRLHRDRIRERLAGLILVHTTPVNPFETMAPVPLHRMLQKALHEPLLHVTIALSPLVRLMSWLSYWNGTAHWDNALQLFAGRETREQLDRTARLTARLDPAAQARCALGMTRYDARRTLGSVDVPTLVVSGDKDGVTVPSAGDAIAEGITGAGVLMLHPARHMGYMECSATFATAVRELWQETKSDHATRSERRSPARPRRRRSRHSRSASRP
jgi:pimeloyl-ACP methyl ester carboxylesterase